MPNVKRRSSRRTLISYAGLSIIGQCLETAGVDSIDSRYPRPLERRNSDAVKSHLGLMCLEMSDDDAIENFRHVEQHRQAKVPPIAMGNWV